MIIGDKVYLVMDIKDEITSRFEIRGIYSMAVKAWDACTEKTHVYSEIEINHTYPLETVYMDCVCPKEGIVYMADGTVKTKNFVYEEAK
jgi:hypothetical protein